MQVMDQVFFLLFMAEARGPWKQGRKKRESITCRTDRANKANRMFIIWLCWLFRFWKGDRELEVRTATYGSAWNWPITAREIISHIIKRLTRLYCKLDQFQTLQNSYRPYLICWAWSKPLHRWVREQCRRSWPFELCWPYMLISVVLRKFLFQKRLHRLLSRVLSIIW